MLSVFLGVEVLLTGSAFDAASERETTLVDEDEIKDYFAAMLLAGSLSVAANRVSGYLGIESLTVVSIVLIFGATLFVSAAVVLAAVCHLRIDPSRTWCRQIVS